MYKFTTISLTARHYIFLASYWTNFSSYTLFHFCFSTTTTHCFEAHDQTQTNLSLPSNHGFGLKVISVSHFRKWTRSFTVLEWLRRRGISATFRKLQMRASWYVTRRLQHSFDRTVCIYIVTCRGGGERVTKITGSRSNVWICWHFDYKFFITLYYNAIAILHTFTSPLRTH
jgi:hypothetical protein